MHLHVIIQGETGDHGRIGLKGVRGEAGLRGEHGLNGWKGETGDFGIQGEPGLDGQPGNMTESKLLKRGNDKSKLFFFNEKKIINIPLKDMF